MGVDQILLGLVRFDSVWSCLTRFGFGYVYGVMYVWISFAKGFELFELFLIGSNKIV